MYFWLFHKYTQAIYKFCGPESHLQIVLRQHQTPEIKKAISMTYIQNNKRALLCLWFVYSAALVPSSFFNEEYTLLIPANVDSYFFAQVQNVHASLQSDFSYCKFWLRCSPFEVRTQLAFVATSSLMLPWCIKAFRFSLFY